MVEVTRMVQWHCSLLQCCETHAPDAINMVWLLSEVSHNGCSSLCECFSLSQHGVDMLKGPSSTSDEQMTVDFVA